MLNRKIEKTLLEWKDLPNHNPLIIKGCRQCGKTYSVLKFAHKHYKHVIYINFFENPAYISIFNGSLKIDDLILYMSAALGSKAVFEEKHTCIILDEIQECPNARTSLKFFKQDGRFDVICTGSLLGVNGYKERTMSIPVGYETIINMFPLDFEEFLWANNIPESVIDNLKECLSTCTAVHDLIHERMNELLLQYTVVGGMPAVVNEFIASHQINNVLQLQRDIVNGYGDDMVKYADKSNKSKIRECFYSIPKQLGKENKKFQYSIIKKGASSVKYEGSLQWIEDAGIIRRCYNLNITELPLDGNADKNIFKVYMADIGLFVSMLEDGTQYDILKGNLLGYKGAIFENLVADFFGKMGRKLYYFHKDSGLEVDFVIRYKGECILVECKSNSGNIKSTKTVLKHPEKYHVYNAIKLGNYNVGKSGNITTLPLYMGFLLIER
ncbi:MAG: ATP-binding protein [Muribaculaceae bacterium]|nr:ATP-binding protein [Muribaculaceae bacterium]